jgi:hypothetical protein
MMPQAESVLLNALTRQASCHLEVAAKIIDTLF